MYLPAYDDQKIIKALSKFNKTNLDPPLKVFFFHLLDRHDLLDADVDGMHIRLLLITFFLQFFPELIKEGHLYILQTPLFRVRNKKETIYCYTEQERIDAIEKLKPKPEITRFKGLGEISPNEFKHFIGDDIRLDPVMLDTEKSIGELLSFYMGKNTPERQKFIIDNLKVELDLIDPVKSS